MKFIKKICALCIAGLLAVNAVAQSYTNVQLNNYDFSSVKWSRAVMDSLYQPTCCDNLATAAVMAKYKPEVDRYDKVIGYSPKGLTRDYPVGALDSWAVDALHAYAQKWLDTTGHSDVKIDFALLNFGGIRADFPSGNITRFNVLSTFPFNNYLVVAKLPGKVVKQLMELFAATSKIQVMSNVKIKIDGKKVTYLTIDGEPLDEQKVYNVATIDFLLNGGDKLSLLKKNIGTIESNIKVMDIMFQTIDDLTAEGKPIEKEIDDRASTNDEERFLN